jgi:hypothetical protein
MWRLMSARLEGHDGQLPEPVQLDKSRIGMVLALCIKSSLKSTFANVPDLVAIYDD